jgi:hypothetical protein
MAALLLSASVVSQLVLVGLLGAEDLNLFTGIIRSVDADQATLTVSDEDDKTTLDLKCTDQSRIELNRKEVSLADLEVGMKVSVTYRADGTVQKLRVVGAKPAPRDAPAAEPDAPPVEDASGAPADSDVIHDWKPASLQIQSQVTSKSFDLDGEHLSLRPGEQYRLQLDLPALLVSIDDPLAIGMAVALSEAPLELERAEFEAGAGLSGEFQRATKSTGKLTMRMPIVLQLDVAADCPEEEFDASISIPFAVEMERGSARIELRIKVDQAAEPPQPGPAPVKVTAGALAGKWTDANQSSLEFDATGGCALVISIANGEGVLLSAGATMAQEVGGAWFLSFQIGSQTTLWRIVLNQDARSLDLVMVLPQAGQKMTFTKGQ